jgi:rare lipoprotein A
MKHPIIAGVLAATLIISVAFFAGSAAIARECGWMTYYKATGNKTACGDRYTGEEMYAAHRSLPCGTKLRVTDKATGKSVNVTVRDRGPAKWTGNDLDLSFRAARMIGMVHRGRIRGCWG